MLNLTNLLRYHSRNIHGWRSNRKIVVFESDDWGSIRMPNKLVYNKCLKLGLPVDKSPYTRFDTLANSDDINSLFDLLASHRDCNGNHPIITANTVVANPDFTAIRASGYNEYTYVTIKDTLKDYYPNSEIFQLWKEGIHKELFYPQFHGREHVNVYHWLNALRKGNHSFVTAFNNNFWGLNISANSDSIGINIQATYDAFSKKELKMHKKSLLDGLKLFELLFGFRSKSFVPNNFIFDLDNLLPSLKHNGINILQGMKYHVDPYYDKHKHPMRRRKIGIVNGVVNLMRNCIFEPSQEKTKKNVVDKCLKEMEIAFYWGKPAIISTHRLNFIGAINENNRLENLKLFGELLSRMLQKWPDLEFMHTENLAALIS